MNIKKIFGSEKKKRKEAMFLPSGFHGDIYLQEVVQHLSKDVKYFVETGTNVGSTLSYFAERNPSVVCLSCEPDEMSYKAALKNTRNLKNITIFNLDAPSFLQKISSMYEDIFETKTLFWLDAHGYGFEWPLKYEIEFISRNFKKAFVLIDDFKVPGKDHFLYDQYRGQECSYDYIEKSIKTKNYKVFYPAYDDRTSEFHPLKGWGLILIGAEWTPSEEISKKIVSAQIK